MDQAGTGDDKTDIVVIADFWERLGGVFSGIGTFQQWVSIPFGGFDIAAAISLAAFKAVVCFRHVLRAGGTHNSASYPLPHSAPNRATSPFYKNRMLLIRMRIQAHRHHRPIRSRA